MKNLLFLFLAFQLAFAAVAVAQITFTREWVTGKRSLPSPHIMDFRDKHSWCSRSFIPIIEDLLETERIRKKECGPGVHLKLSVPKTVAWSRTSPLEELPKTSNLDKEDDSMQYDADVLSQKISRPIVIQSQIK